MSKTASAEVTETDPVTEDVSASTIDLSMVNLEFAASPDVGSSTTETTADVTLTVSVPLNEFVTAAVMSVSVDDSEKSIEQKILDCEHRIADICREEESLKASAKAMKGARISEVDRLNGLIFDRDNPDSGDSESAAVSKSPSGSTTVSSVESDRWGLDEIEVLGKHGLKEKKVESLREAASKGHFNGTVRGLRDWIAKYDLWYREVKSCGPTGADKITDALTAYVAANPVADKPMTAEDDARSEAAAEFLGHTKPELSQPDDSAEFDTPEEKAAYSDGCLSGAAGEEVSSNPHKRGTGLWRAWDKGWQKHFVEAE